MPPEPFTHDAGTFVPAPSPSGVGVSEDESRYAALFAELSWDGELSADKRHRLRTAAELFGISDARAAAIEAAILAAEVRPDAPAVEAPAPTEGRDRGSPLSLAPLVGREAAASRESFDELRFVELDARVDALESDNGKLVADAERLTRDNERLTGLVERLRRELAVAAAEVEAAHSRRLTEQATSPRASRPKLESKPRASRPKLESRPRASRPKLDAAAGEGRTEPGVTIPERAGVKHRSRRRITRVPPPPTSPEGLRVGSTQERVSFSSPAPTAAGPSAAVAPPSSFPAVASPSSPPTTLATPPLPSAPPLPRFESPSGRPAGPRNQPEELHRLLRRSPRDPDLLRALFRSLQRADDVDRRWCIAHALGYLGEANDQERATHLAHADDGLVRPWRALRDDEWTSGLLHPDQDPLFGELLGEIAPAVLLGRVTSLRPSLSNEAAGDAREIDPKVSTEPAVRSLAWSAVSLGLKLPPVFLAHELDRALDVILAPRPASRLGARVLTGRTPRELAFLAGQHLAWFRREHVLAQPDASVRRLEDWVLAALRIGNPEIPLTPETRERVEPLAVTVLPLLDEAQVARLRRGYARFVERGARMNLGRWLDAVRVTAACAGLLLANDLGAAGSALRLVGANDVENTLDELIVYFTSRRCSELRRRLGIAVDS